MRLCAFCTPYICVIFQRYQHSTINSIQHENQPAALGLEFFMPYLAVKIPSNCIIFTPLAWSNISLIPDILLYFIEAQQNTCLPRAGLTVQTLCLFIWLFCISCTLAQWYRYQQNTSGLDTHRRKRDQRGAGRHKIHQQGCRVLGRCRDRWKQGFCLGNIIMLSSNWLDLPVY